MVIVKILAGGFLGTSLMTLFSYVLSYLIHTNLKEPGNLAILFHRSFPNRLSESLSVFTGWIFHYLVGYAFLAIYSLIWQHYPCTILSAVVLGAVSGLIAVIVWQIVLTVHPDPPKVNFLLYHTNLIIGHIIFAVTALVGYLAIV